MLLINKIDEDLFEIKFEGFSFLNIARVFDFLFNMNYDKIFVIDFTSTVGIMKSVNFNVGDELRVLLGRLFKDNYVADNDRLHMRFIVKKVWF